MKYTCVYNCPTTKYKIEYIVDTETESAMLNTIVCDYIYIKALMSLIRISIDKLTEKNIKMIRQSVAFGEWDMYLGDKTTWKIIGLDNDNHIYEIECGIDDFLSNYGIGIGLMD